MVARLLPVHTIPGTELALPSTTKTFPRAVSLGGAAGRTRRRRPPKLL
jgi:hypothetical protein